MALIHPRVPPQVSLPAETLSVNNLAQVSNNDPSSRPASLDQWGTLNQHTLSGSGTNSHDTVNQNVGFVHDDQVIRNEANAEFEQETSEEALSSTVPLVVPSTSTHVAESYITKEISNSTEKLVEMNGNQPLETQAISLKGNEQEHFPDQVLNLLENTPANVCKETSNAKDQDVVQDSACPLELIPGHASPEDEVPAVVMETEVLPDHDESNEVEKILQCFVDSNPDSE